MSEDHGARLSGEEYDRRVAALYADQPAAPSRQQQKRLRRAELDLTIDHRLGRDFPADRRDALWAAYERIESRRTRLVLWQLLRRILPGGLAKRAQGLAERLVQECAEVLTPDELKAFFGEDESRRPALPVDHGD